MADISITAADVKPTAGTKVVKTLNADVNITAGQALYEKTGTGGAANTYALAQADVALNDEQSRFAGLAMHGALQGQPVQCAKGTIQIAASGLTIQQVNLSATAGGIAPTADLASNSNIVTIGCIISATTIDVQPKHWGVRKA